MTLFRRGGGHCFGSASPVISGDLRAHYNWVAFAVRGGAAEPYGGALISMCVIHTRSVPLQAGCQYVEQPWRALALGFFFLFL